MLDIASYMQAFTKVRAIMLSTLSAMLATMFRGDSIRFHRTYFRGNFCGRPISALCVSRGAALTAPLAVYLPGLRGSLSGSLPAMEALASEGFTALSFDFDQTYQRCFDDQLDGVLTMFRRLAKSPDGRMVFVGFSLGAEMLLRYMNANPAQQPSLFISISGAWLGDFSEPPVPELRCHSLFVHGELDRVSPVSKCIILVKNIEESGACVELRIVKGAPHDMGRQREAVYRSAAIYGSEFLGLRPSGEPR